MGRLAEWSSLIPGAVRNSRYASLMVHPYEEETLLESCTKKFGFPSPNPHIRGGKLSNLEGLQGEGGTNATMPPSPSDPPPNDGDDGAYAAEMRLIAALEAQERLVEAKRELADAIKAGRWDLTTARFQMMGTSSSALAARMRVGALMTPASGEAMAPSFAVRHDDEREGGRLALVELPDDDDEEIAVDGDGEEGKKEDRKGASKRNKRLAWFGALPPASLRSAQTRCVRARVRAKAITSSSRKSARCPTAAAAAAVADADSFSTRNPKVRRGRAPRRARGQRAARRDRCL